MQYKILTADACLADIFKRYHHPRRFIEACRQCPNFGRQWSCPPLAEDYIESLKGYKTITVCAVEIPVQAGTPSHKAVEVMEPEHPLLTDYLMRLEHETGGRAACTIGKCRLCKDFCARLSGHPCRHPDLMRPSPEALGFDLQALLHDLFSIDLQWSSAETLPPKLYLIGALFHD